MADFLMAAAIAVLVIAGVGLLRVFRGPTDIDRVMAVQMLGTGGVAVLVLLAAVSDAPGTSDVALTLALLAALAVAAFARSDSAPGGDDPV
jgi:multicomponent Na+:H+ antiporter subunit F